MLRQELAKLGEGMSRQRRKPLSTATRQQAAKPSYLSLKGREEEWAYLQLVDCA